MTEQEIQDGIEWIRRRPKSIHEMMVRFPPSCRVRAIIPLHVPAPGKIGKIVSYIEPDGDNPPMIRVIDDPDGEIAAECQQEWLEVVDYWEHCTPEFVKLALGITDGD